MFTRTCTSCKKRYNMFSFDRKNKYNRVHMNSLFAGLKTLLVSKLFHSGEVVLGAECLQDVRSMWTQWEQDVRVLLDTHTQKYLKFSWRGKSHTTQIQEEEWYGNYCRDDYEYRESIRYQCEDVGIVLKRKGDDKLPLPKMQLLCRVMTQIDNNWP